MTIEEMTTPSPQHPTPLDVESLVRTLAKRVAILEGQRNAPPDEATHPDLQTCEVDHPSRSTSTISARGGDGSLALMNKSVLSIQNNDNKDDRQPEPVVEGIPEDDAEEALADRVLLIERRLDDAVDILDRKPNDPISDDEIPLPEDEIPLPESTFSLLITHDPLTIPFGFAVFTIALSNLCLCLVMASSISGTETNRLSIPAGCDPVVRAAQVIGIIVGTLMEEEIPQGLQFIANAAGHTLLLNGEKLVQERVVVTSTLRLIVGYLFLTCLFFQISQNDNVIQIFYDVLALEFVEKIDDTTFALAKRGFFGRSMLIATNEKHALVISDTLVTRPSPMCENNDSVSWRLSRRLSRSGLMSSNNPVNLLVRFVYFLNVVVTLSGLGYIAKVQNQGHFRCSRINVLFEEEIWEKAFVTSNGTIEERLLIYPHFNGVYQEDGSHDGRPRYVELNKSDGDPFDHPVKGAEIVYCSKIGSWVFRHDSILTNQHKETGNDCQWLWKSAPSQSFDILSTMDAGWETWVGKAKPLTSMSITCTECSERFDCNNFGNCVDSKCECDSSHFGEVCEFEWPCYSLATEKANTPDPAKRTIKWEQENPILIEGRHIIYNRPVYIQEGLSGEPFDMRLHKIIEKITTTIPTLSPSMGSTPTVGTDRTLEPTDDSGPPTPTTAPMTYPPTNAWPSHSPTILPPTADPSTARTNTPTQPLYTENEYGTNRDFADWDDFFESKPLHDGLEDILEDYSIAISYSGSRFYGTIMEPFDSLDEWFPKDYHAFWSQAFNENRTFIISDKTFARSPVGVDFFEMRRRIDSLLNPDVMFTYGPYGVLIPVMDYQGAGFFHCLESSSHPSTSPSSSAFPTN